MNVDVVSLLSAISFAAQKHRDQRRKDEAASPYINHPIALAHLLASTGGVDDIVVLQGAILHDTVEDTETTYEGQCQVTTDALRANGYPGEKVKRDPSAPITGDMSFIFPPVQNKCTHLQASARTAKAQLSSSLGRASRLLVVARED